MRQSRQMPRGIALCSAVALVGITIAISAGGREVRADFGSSPGEVSGTGTIVVGSVTETVSVSAVFDLVNPPTGSFSIETSSGGPAPTPLAGTVTCLFFTPWRVVVGVLLPDPYLFFISDGGPTGVSDTLEVFYQPGGPDCTSQGSAPTLLSSGNFTVIPDGIDDTLQPSGTPAYSFLDASVPQTYGSIVSTGGLFVFITDAPAPDGVVMRVGSGALGTQVELSVCGFTVLLDPSTTTTGTCGSVTLTVITGTAKVVLGGGTTVVSIPAGGAATVTDTGGGSFSVANVGAVAVSLTVDGTITPIPAGATVTAEPWDFVGFAQPIDNAPVLNRVKAGQAVPIKWRLVDGAGAPITNLSSASITAATLDCSLDTTIDQVEEAVAGSSGLQNLGNGYYQMNWKSPTTYATSCKTLHVHIGGVTYDALFQFTK